MKKWIIEVTAITDAEDLDPDDLDEHGECLVDGAYRLHTDGDLAESDDPQEAALDVFHSARSRTTTSSSAKRPWPMPGMDGCVATSVCTRWCRRRLPSTSERSPRDVTHETR